MTCKHFLLHWRNFNHPFIFRLLIFISFLLYTLFSPAQNVPDKNKNQIGDTAYHRKVVTDFFQLQASVKYIYQCSLNPSATKIAWCSDGENGQAIFIKSLSPNDNAIRITAASVNQSCNESEPQWSPDGKEIAFLSDAQTTNQLQIFIADASTGALLTKQPLTHFDGYVSHLYWSPDGKYLSVLYVEEASREPSPMAAEDRAVGIVDSMTNRNVQYIAVVNRATGETHQETPSQLYIFEYDWSPDSKFFCYTAAPPPGDDNWYIAKLYTQNIFSGDTTVIYKPSRQIAVPRWSPDGKQIAFIEGLMSDQGGTGGEIFVADAKSNSQAENLTPGRKSTPSWFTWQPDGNILFTEFVGGSVAITTLNTKDRTTKTMWKGDASIRAGNEETSLSVISNNSSTTIAFIRSAWNELPEIWHGNFLQQAQLAHLNDAIHKPFLKTKNLTWINEGKNVQGWLLYPQNYDSTKHYPMLVCVHGGPAWITTPTWSAPDFNTTLYTQLGYFVFFPNPRGSYGQGEDFTLANRRDWGFGDLRDILSGVDTVILKFPVDNNRIGILGWSYGGFMAMFSITQTNRFRASVAGAGACDWQSYYGQNSIDKWMSSYFEASPYDDPAAYAKVSPVTYIKKAKTPTLILVGERDGEAPAPQSFQFWHALKELHVPTQLVVYADEGHSFEKFENMIDVSLRTIEWFNTHMKP
ncbi:MAG TPA: prolyl oligopeptidase family serine peptidase [Chitinophagaceae bacterium]